METFILDDDHKKSKSQKSSKTESKSYQFLQKVGLFRENANVPLSSGQDFMSYMLSLMRSHGNENSDMLPCIDVSSMQHVAYVMDAFVYYLREVGPNNRNALKKSSNASKKGKKNARGESLPSIVEFDIG